jgi:hypothetical protein
LLNCLVELLHHGLFRVGLLGLFLVRLKRGRGPCLGRWFMASSVVSCLECAVLQVDLGWKFEGLPDTFNKFPHFVALLAEPDPNPYLHLGRVDFDLDSVHRDVLRKLIAYQGQQQVLPEEIAVLALDPQANLASKQVSRVLPLGLYTVYKL